MDERLKILLNKGRSETYINKDTAIKIDVDNTSRPLPLNDIDTTVSAYDQFQKEREESTIYRFYGFVSPIVSNPLYNDNIKIFKEEGEIKSTKIIANEIFEKDGWIGYYQDNSLVSTNQVVSEYDATYNGTPTFKVGVHTIHLSTLVYINFGDIDMGGFYSGQIIQIKYKNPQTGHYETTTFIVADTTAIATSTLGVRDADSILYNILTKGDNVTVIVTSDVTNDAFNDNKSSLCEFYPFDPGYDRLGFLDDDNKPNYLMKITYPFRSINNIKLLSRGKTLAEGIPLMEKLSIPLNGRNYTGFRSPINHGLSTGDQVKIEDIVIGNALTGATPNIYSVAKLGDDTNDNKSRIFAIDHDPSLFSINVGKTTFKRVVNTKVSEYYIREYSALTQTYVDYDLYPAAYGTTYFHDKQTAFNFKVDVDVKGIKDNLGRPLSELFLTIIKNNEDGATGNINTDYWVGKQGSSGITENFWTPIKGGYDIGEVVDTTLNYNIRSINDNAYNQTHFQDIDESDNSFIGDIVEYNEYELLERILETPYHWINTEYRENYSIFGPSLQIGEDLEAEKLPPLDKKEGYIYKPHNRIVIREYSSYVETGITGQTLNIPDYATDAYSGSSTTKRWRDLLSIGFYDIAGQGVNYPFESGAHYLFLNSRFYLKRQDPACNYSFVDTNLQLPPDKKIFLEIISQPSFYDYSLLNAELFINLDNNGITDLGGITLGDEVKYGFQRPPKFNCGGNFRTELDQPLAGNKTLTKPSGAQETRWCAAKTGWVLNAGGTQQSIVDESKFECEADDAWDDVANKNASVYPSCNSPNSTKYSNFCLEAAGLGQIVVKKFKDKSGACLRYLDVEVRSIEYSGEYSLGQVDTPGACISYGAIETKDIDDVC